MSPESLFSVWLSPQKCDNIFHTLNVTIYIHGLLLSLVGEITVRFNQTYTISQLPAELPVYTSPNFSPFSSLFLFLSTFPFCSACLSQLLLLTFRDVAGESSSGSFVITVIMAHGSTLEI